MTDDFEPRVQRWLRERGTVEAETLESVTGQIALLPPRRTSGRRPWLAGAVAAVLVVAVAIGIVLGPRISGGPSPVPPDPAAFAGDPRLTACFGGAGEVQYAFEMTHARDYQRYLPNMLLAPELDVDSPGFVVVFAAGVVPSVGLLPPGPADASETPSAPVTAPPPSHRSVCILVDGAPNLYSDVDIDGLRTTVDESSPPPSTAAVGWPDPSAFRGDPRFTACLGSAEAESAFEVAHARDVRRYLPSFTGREPPLDSDAPALVVIMSADYRQPPMPGPSGGAPWPTSGPTDRYVCIVVGPVDPFAGPGQYFGSIAGFDPSPAGVEPIRTAAATIQPAPSRVADLAGQLDCDGAVADIGGEVEGFGAGQGPSATDPDSALRGLLEYGGFASFPAKGFEPAVVEGHWARHDYLVDGRRKAVAVSSDQLVGLPTDIGWQIAGIRACDPSEFDPADGLTSDQTLWLGAEGAPVPAATIRALPGPGHCGWESAVFLQLDGDQYIRDPLGVLADHALEPFDLDVALPEGAVDTGYHTSDWHVFTVAPGDAVYVRTSAGTFERWGRLPPGVGCA